MRPLEISLINCKVELKLKWTKDCVLCAAGADNVNANSNNIILTMKDTKLYVSAVTLSARDNEKLSDLLNKEFEKSVYLNEFKTKSENKNTTYKYRYFLESNFVWVNRLFALVYSNQVTILKDLKLKDITYQKALLIIITSSSMEKTFMTKQLIQI